MIQIETEGDIEELGFAFARQPDNSYLRTWELAGAAVTLQRLYPTHADYVAKFKTAAAADLSKDSLLRRTTTPLWPQPKPRQSRKARLHSTP